MTKIPKTVAPKATVKQVKNILAGVTRSDIRAFAASKAK